MRNFVVLTGNLTKDPELKKVKELDIASFSIGVYKAKDKSFFVNIQAYNSQAIRCKELLKKGNKVEIIGKLDIITHEKDNKKVYYTVVTCEKFEIINYKDKVYSNSNKDPESVKPNIEEEIL